MERSRGTFYIFQVLFLNNSSYLTWHDWLKTEDKCVGLGCLKHYFPCMSASGHVITSPKTVGRWWLFPDFRMKTSNLTWLKHELASDILLPCAVQWVQGGWESIWELWYQRGSRMHMRARTHTLNIYYKFSFHHWVIQIIKSVNVGGCLASCQSNKGNWVTVCMHFCVLRLPLQADQVSKTNSASSTSLSFRAHALVPRVKNRRGLSTIECTWACRALRINTPSNRKYAKEVIEPLLLSFCAHCFWWFCGQPSGRRTRLDNQAFWKKKKSILTHRFYLFFFSFLGIELLSPTLSSNLQWNSFMKL